MITPNWSEPVQEGSRHVNTPGTEGIIPGTAIASRPDEESVEQPSGAIHCMNHSS